VASATVQSAAPVNTVAPVVSGSATRGATLTASSGTWTNPGSAYAYQWQRSGSTSGSWVNIAGAGSSTYTPTTADEGAQLRVQVTTATQWGLATASSAATGKVQASPPVNTKAPAITGSAKVGVVLTATAGTWSGTGNSYSYQWQRNTAQGYVAIKGATAATYQAATADQGAQLRVLVTAVNPDGTAGQVSNSTSAVASH
jgi:fibronectin type 3 domain-containing protein